MPGPLVILDFESFPASAAEQIRLEAASVPVDEAPAKGSHSTAAPRALMTILSSGNPQRHREQGQQKGAFMDLLETTKL